jgi:hypothetical protein
MAQELFSKSNAARLSGRESCYITPVSCGFKCWLHDFLLYTGGVSP